MVYTGPCGPPLHELFHHPVGPQSCLLVFVYSFSRYINCRSWSQFFSFFSKGQMKNYQLRAVYCSYSQTFINIRPLLAEIMPQTLRIIFFHFCNRQVNVSNFRQDNVKHFVSCGNNNSSNPSNAQKDRTVNYQDFRGICSISIFNVL